MFNDVPISVLIFAEEAFFTALSCGSAAHSKLNIGGRPSSLPSTLSAAAAASDLLMWLQEVRAPAVSATSHCVLHLIDILVM